jgi:hypothetical protein
MNEARVLLTRLSVRKSARGNEYLLGFLGAARVVGFKSREPDRFGNEQWELYLAEPPREARGPAGEPGRPAARRDQGAPQQPAPRPPRGARRRVGLAVPAGRGDPVLSGRLRPHLERAWRESCGAASDDDRVWFERHPARNFRLRAPIADEVKLCPAAPPRRQKVLVRQIKPGFRVRIPFTWRDRAPLLNSEQVCEELFLAVCAGGCDAPFDDDVGS